jgi:hypothetical protein
MFLLYVEAQTLSYCRSIRVCTYVSRSEKDASGRASLQLHAAWCLLLVEPEY